MSVRTPSIREVLAATRVAGDVVSIERRIANSDTLRGVVVAEVGEWVVLQSLDWDTILNGYSVIRIADVLDLTVVGGGGPECFSARALRYFKQRPGVPESLDLTTPSRLLTSAAEQFHLLTVHTEWIDPDVCYIGTPVGTIDDRITLREITPEALWDEGTELRGWNIEDVTQVEFGGRYEEALFALSAAPPRRRDSKQGRPNLRVVEP